MPKVRKLSPARARQMAAARWARQRQAEAITTEATLRWIDQSLGLPPPAAPVEPAAPLDVASALVGIQNTLREMPASVVLAAAELGIGRAEAERLGDLALLLVTVAVAESAVAAGVVADPDAIEVPAPDQWRGTVAWGALYDQSGASVVAGAIAAASAEEAEAAEG